MALPPSLIADALLVRGIEASEITSGIRTRPHSLTPWARVNGTQVTYPAAQCAKDQSWISDHQSDRDTAAPPAVKSIELLTRQLLARERVDQGFEHRWKSGRLHASECVGECPQPRIACGCVVPVGQIDPKPEQPIKDRSRMSSSEQRPRRGRCRHDQPRRGRRACLLHRQFGRPSFHDDHPSVGGAIPAVDQVAWATPKRPHREIETKRRNWPQHERECARAVIHEGNHCSDRRGRCAALVRLDLARRRAFFRRNSCKATALLCCVSCEL